MMYDADTLSNCANLSQIDIAVALYCVTSMPLHLDILQEYGETIDLYEHSLSNAMRLADGALPMVAVMQEPCNLADDVPYETMMYGDPSTTEWSPRRIGCPALQEVEKLVEETSHGRYGLEDISIFDLNTLLSRDIQDDIGDPEDLQAALSAAHHTFWSMIVAKRPKVIVVLSCAAGRSENEDVRSLWSSLKAAGSMKRITLSDDGDCYEAMVFRGFHPSTYLRDDYREDANWSDEQTKAANDILRLCFVQAFAKLEGDKFDHANRRKMVESWRARFPKDDKTNPLAGAMGDLSIA